MNKVPYIPHNHTRQRIANYNGYQMNLMLLWFSLPSTSTWYFAFLNIPVSQLCVFSRALVLPSSRAPFQPVGSYHRLFLKLSVPLPFSAHWHFWATKPTMWYLQFAPRECKERSSQTSPWHNLSEVDPASLQPWVQMVPHMPLFTEGKLNTFSVKGTSPTISQDSVTPWETRVWSQSQVQSTAPSVLIAKGRMGWKGTLPRDELTTLSC